MNDGGPAYPQPLIEVAGRVFSSGAIEPMGAGMTLRDYFAAAALQGMCSGAVGFIGGSDEASAYAKGPCNHVIADRAYVLADMMLWRRERTERNPVRLVEAASELLSACEAVRETCPADPDITPQWQAAWDSMLAAIAKAKGRSAAGSEG